MAIIALEGLEFRAFHGVYESERKNGGDFIVDVYLETNFNSAELSDQLSDTIDYAEVYAIVAKIMSEPVNLLEYLVALILNRILENYPSCHSVTVRASKMSPPLDGKCNRTYVESTRTRKDVNLEVS